MADTDLGASNEGTHDPCRYCSGGRRSRSRRLPRRSRQTRAASRRRSRRCSPRVKLGVQIEPLLTVGRRASERLSIRGDPGRHLRAHAGPGQNRPLRQPRDQQGAVPVQHGHTDRGERGERLRQRAGEPADPQPAFGRCAERAVRRSRVRSASSASARTTSRRRRRSSAASIFFTNEESPDYVLRQEDSWPPPIGDPAERGGRRRGRARRPDRQERPDLRDGQAQPREQRRRSPGTGTRSSSPATTRSRAVRSGRFRACRRGPVAVAALLLHRAEHRCRSWPTRATSGRSSPTRQA